MDRSIFLSFLMILCTATVTFAGHWYVAVTGNDLASGTQQDPWRHIQYAIDTVQGSSTERAYIHVMEGTYQESLLIDENDTYESVLGVSAASVIVDSNGNRCLHIKNPEHIEVSNITFQNSVITSPGGPSSALLVEGTANEVHDCVVRQNRGLYQSGVMVTGPNVIRNCEFYENTCPDGNGHGTVYIAYPDGAVVYQNSIHDNYAYYNGGVGIFLFYTTATVEENRVYDNVCEDGVAAIHLKYGYPTFRNNVIDHNTSSANGVLIRLEETHPVFENNLIVDNNSPLAIRANGGFQVADIGTFSLNTIVHTGIGVTWTDCPSPAQHAPITNSIIWTTGACLVISNSDLQLSYSCLNSSDTGIGVIHDDPLFIDPASGDYHLSPGSPCIDAGDPITDFCDEPWPNGCRVNLGAYGNTAYAAYSSVLTCTPTCEPTAAPSATPTETPTPEATAIPPTQSPSPTVIPTFTPTQIPAEGISMDLILNKSIIHAGDLFTLTLVIDNSGPLIQFDQYVCLEAYGMYYFYPAWTPDVTSMTRSLGPYSMITDELLNVTMPDPLPSGGPFHFYGLLINAQTGDLLTDLVAATFVLI